MSERPFDPSEQISASAVQRLRQWLEQYGDDDAMLGPSYSIADLIADLERIEQGIWSDGVDAMGEDA